MNSEIREKALAVLNEASAHTPLDVHNAIVDLGRNGKIGDEELLQGFLDYPDEMVVSATLFALIHVYGSMPGLVDLLLRFANGDSRDTGEMPIQAQAIEGLALFSRDNPTVIAKLMAVANDSATAEAPRARAWKCLAKLFGVPWEHEYTEAMIWDPDSEKSGSIREVILNAIEEKNKG